MLSMAATARTEVLPPRRVLIVDDNADAADTLSLLLESEGFDTAVAHSGRDALAVAASFKPTYVLLDLNMPELDGFETADLLARHRPMCLIALSADNTTETLSRLANSPFQAHLTKPTSLEEIANVMKRCDTSGMTPVKSQ